LKACEWVGPMEAPTIHFKNGVMDQNFCFNFNFYMLSDSILEKSMFFLVIQIFELYSIQNKLMLRTSTTGL